jgi:beta-galactosidase
MKRLVSVIGLFMIVAGMKAQVNDAFQGVLPVTDHQMMRSLNGIWQLKVVEGIGNDMIVPVADDSWRSIPVPGCWEAYGFCKPNYDKANALTGYYRTSFMVPEEWRGQHVVLRFDGVLYGYDLWINGKAVGSWRSAYNTAFFDVTPYLVKGAEQQLALRVVTQFPGSDFDYNDDWAPSGIFRDVTLMAVPETHLMDLTIHAHLNGQVDVDTEIANAKKGTTVSHVILDALGQVVGTTKVDHPHLWTAETPYLYTLRTTLAHKGKTLQTFEHKFGFRELTIEGNILKLNGQPIKLRGVTSHSTDPLTVKVIDETSILRDMRLMKEASINYIRTSHYPREPRFYELADSLGFYVIDEVPFGYGDKNLSDAAFYPVLQQRAQATIRRDKNHPSVLIWSLGNENPLTDICIKLGDYVKRELDPARPICYPQVGSYFRRFNYDFPKVADIYAPHYPSTAQIADFYQRADRPVIFTEYCHTLGISFEDHDRQWEIIERTPGIAGGSVWEWVDQGMPFKAEMKDRYGYEERVFTTKEGGFEMYGNKGTDGLLYADRTPLPNYYELQHNYARAFVSDVSDSLLTIVNRYDFLNLKDNVTFHWTLTNDRDTVMRGAFSPDCEPHSSTVYTLDMPKQKGLSILQFNIEDAQGYTFLHQSFVLNKPEQEWEGNAGDVMQMVQQGPLVRVGRKPTMAEMLKVKDQRIEKYIQPLDNPYVKADVQSLQQGSATVVSYTFTPDTTDTFLSELGIAYLLDKSIDRVQWIGQGPFASYPGRYQANRYGFWGKHMDDLYFEGNRMCVDAALFTDSIGNGLLVVGDSLNLNFEQTDRGIVMTVNAAVSGQGPKFARTAFPVISKNAGTVTGLFRLYRINAASMPHVIRQLFLPPNHVPLPFRPFEKQYDIYLLKYKDIRR